LKLQSASPVTIRPPGSGASGRNAANACRGIGTAPHRRSLADPHRRQHRWRREICCEGHHPAAIRRWLAIEHAATVTNQVSCSQRSKPPPSVGREVR